MKHENAARFLKIAAQHDNKDACLLLAEMYYRGIGVEKDEAKAQELLEKANESVYQLLE